MSMRKRRNPRLDDDGLPFLPVWLAKWENRTSHLSIEEDGAYWRLIRIAWKSPGCSLPTDPVWLRRMMRCDEATYDRVVAPILGEFFVANGEGADARYTNPKLSEVWATQISAHEKRKNAGKMGGQATAQKTKDIDSTNAHQKRTNAPASHSHSHIQLASKLASARSEIIAACGPGMDPESRPWGVDAFIQIWEAETEDVETILSTVRRFTSQPRDKPLRKLRALNDEVEAAIAAQQNSAQTTVGASHVDLTPPHGKAGQAFHAIVQAKGQAWANSWLRGCEWNGTELYADSELTLTRLRTSVGRILQVHGYTLALNPSGETRASTTSP